MIGVGPAYALLVALVAFSLGSIPSGVIIGRLFFHTDIRSIGSGNIGTTNAMRALGKRGGAAVFIFDFGKGLVSGIIAWIIAWMTYSIHDTGFVFTYAEIVSLAFFASACGHIFSPWLKFRGGKGIAVSVGCLFVTFGPLGAAIELALFAILVVVTKRVSVGSLGAAILCIPLSCYYFWGDTLAIALCSAVALLVIWAHRGNIDRLLHGTEKKFSVKKSSSDTTQEKQMSRLVSDNTTTQVTGLTSLRQEDSPLGKDSHSTHQTEL